MAKRGKVSKDFETVGEIVRPENMEADQSRYATTLQKGEALIFEEQLDKPVLVKMKPFTK